MESADEVRDEIAENWCESPPVADPEFGVCPFFMCWHDATEWVEIPRTENLITRKPIQFRACLYHKVSIGEHLKNLAEVLQSGEIPSRDPNWVKGVLNCERVDNFKEDL